MDSTLIASIVIAVVAIIPGAWALINQGKKDSIQSKIDLGKATQDAAVTIIAPLQTEVTRLQTRVLDLEKILIEKTTEIGRLMETSVDKDSEIRKLEYNLEGLQLRLDAFEIKRKSKSSGSSTEIDKKIEDVLKTAEEKKEKIKLYTNQTIEKIANGHTDDKERIKFYTEQSIDEIININQNKFENKTETEE
jgi:hypothetical protein